MATTTKIAPKSAFCMNKIATKYTDKDAAEYMDKDIVKHSVDNEIQVLFYFDLTKADWSSRSFKVNEERKVRLQRRIICNSRMRCFGQNVFLCVRGIVLSVDQTSIKWIQIRRWIKGYIEP